VYGLTLEYLNDSLTTEEIPEIAPIFLNGIDDEMMSTQYLSAYAFLLSMRTEDSTTIARFAEYGYKQFTETPYFATNAILFYAQHDNFSKVHTIAEKYIDLFPEDPYFYIMLSEAYRDCEEYDNSLAVLDEAMLYDSTNVNVLIQLGGTYHLMKDYARADSVFNKAIKMDPNNDIINNEYAYYLAERNENLVYAHTLIQKALEKRPDNPSYLDTYGWVCYKMKNYSVALEYLGLALEKDPRESTQAVLYEHIGYVYRDKGENAKAIEVWNKAIEKGSKEEQTLLNEIEKLQNK
jgi:tetratricopeptide (TPR) repeat protein